MYKKILLSAVVAFLLIPLYAVVHAQGTIVGTVVDAEEGEPLPGATIQIRALNLGTNTNVEGAFTLSDVPAGTHDLTARFVGYRELSLEVTVADGEEVDLGELELAPDILGLDQLVVTGYGVQRKREVTGSISSLQARQIERQPAITPDQAIQGRSSGVQVQGLTGEPGGGIYMRVRGSGSITAGNDPLFVVDGVPINTQSDIATQGSVNPLSNIRPRDIESIEVLKDASAASIYGAQAANGVVLITTRRGEAGRTQISASSRIGAVQETNRFDVMDSNEWWEVLSEAWENDGFPASAIAPSFLPPEQLDRWQAGDNLVTYDWQDEGYRTGLMQEYSLSARGGTESTRFYVSGSYDFREGQFIRSNYDSFALRANLDHDASDRLSFETNISMSTQSQEGSIRDGNFINGVLFGTPIAPPVENPWIDRDEGIFNSDVPPFGNAVEAVTIEDRLNETRQIVTNVAASYRFTDNLILRNNLGVDYNLFRDTNYRPPEGYYGDDGGTGFEATREVVNFNINPTLNYLTTIAGDHSFNTLVGAEYRREFREEHSVNAQGYPSGLFRTVNSAANITSGAGFQTQYRIAGLFSRVQYNFNERLFSTASIRYDGSSRFGRDNQWGLFYSGSVGYDLTADVLSDIDFISQLQPRISYGTTGNAAIGNFAARGLFGAPTSYQGAPVLRPTQLANPNLGWESSKEINIGLDYQLFDGRIFGDINLFRTDNEDLLLDVSLPWDSGFENYVDNVGSVRNEGIEFEISSVNLNRGGFQWTTDFNITFIRNEITSLVDDQQSLNDEWFVGEPIDVYYYPTFAGVNPASGRSMWYDSDGNITYNPAPIGDAQIQGSPFSDYYGGLNNTFSYRGLSLDVFFQFDMGSKTFLQQQTFFLETPQFTGNMTRNMLDRWQQPGDVTDIARVYPSGNHPGDAEFRTSSSRHVADASYIRLKDVRLSYLLPDAISQTLGIGSMTFFAQGTNLVTWTEYPGMDPEVVGTSNAFYPQPRTFSGGISIDF